jgi:hypothetical protein
MPDGFKLGNLVFVGGGSVGIDRGGAKNERGGEHGDMLNLPLLKLFDLQQGMLDNNCSE